MQHIDDIRHNYFMESKKIISDLLYTENPEDLVDNKYMIDKLLEKVSFLKVLSETPEIFSETQIEQTDDDLIPVRVEDSEIEETVSDDEFKSDYSDEPSKFEFVSEVSEPETRDLEEITKEDESLDIAQEQFENESEPDFLAFSDGDTVEDLINEQLIEEATISEEAYQKSVEQVENEIDMPESNPDTQPDEQQENNFEETPELPQNKPEKKFKIPNIKGLKAVESLFDEEHLEPNFNSENESGSLLKTNVSTDFMEAAKPKQEFRLDLNDRIAFSKMLFNGSQSDLNDAVNRLNSYRTLDEAKEYLSEIYYQRNWNKVDEYAQRLWLLVENKFQ